MSTSLPHQPNAETSDQRTYEQRSFWAQNVFTGLLLGHGAAFLALMTGVLGADDPGGMARWAQAPAKLFGIGIGLSYGVAVFMWLARGGWNHPRWARDLFNWLALIAAVASALVFAAGVANSVSALGRLQSKSDPAPCSAAPLDCGAQPTQPSQGAAPPSR